MATPDKFHERVQQIIEDALRVPSDRRDAFVKRACEDDDALLDEALSLLPHYQRMRDFKPDTGVDWFLPGTTTLDRACDDADALEEDPAPPFCIDQYRCEEVLGRGGMGVVYRAVHATLKRPFAIKLMRRGLVSPEDRWRFAFEAELLRRLRHQGIARVFHANEVRTVYGSQPYFVMEYIRGRPLTSYTNDAGLGTLELLALFAKVCEPIEFAHRRGIVHADLKPGNIIVDDTGAPIILDFGIARIENFSPAARTDEGKFLGTLAYASPEQIARKNNLLTPSSDVYSLGLILHKLLTGRLPRTDSGMLKLDLSRLRLGDGAPTNRLKEFRYFMRIIFSAALAGSPAKRYSRAGEFGDAVSAVMTEFTRPSLWSTIRARLARLIHPQSAKPAPQANRPLVAVLRTRIAMSMEREAVRDSDDRPSLKP